MTIFSWVNCFVTLKDEVSASKSQILFQFVFLCVNQVNHCHRFFSAFAFMRLAQREKKEEMCLWVKREKQEGLSLKSIHKNDVIDVF